MKKLLMLPLLFWCFTTMNAQENVKKWSVSTDGYLFISGDYSSTYESAIGLTAKYNLSTEKKLKPFVGANYIRSLGGTNVLLNGFGVLGGFDYDFGKNPYKGFYASVYGGGIYLNERFSFLFANEEREETITNFGFQAGLDIGYQFNRSIRLSTGIQQLNTEGTGIKIGLTINF
ncbi:hypothetical protein ACFSTE_14055 [Aquimarina hainanensis]|uniref:Outer membrane protein beta-barrel domain-containing protein n=1 Tax=Aquimarina hainanensis TaxID=1578017 RepID=A0ABW5NA65_9FLAO|nr:hypothetical protein [Aquimarina sp. TRL1]QKX03991.1 hypothetical protein HN014_03420 [Aquimarina sp. TRL1]